MDNTEQELFVGRLGVNPKLKYTKDQKPVCFLSVAINKNEDEKAIWKKVVVWEKQAEQCNLYLKKGSRLFVQGRIENKEYLTKDGNTKTYEEVRASLIGFLTL